MNNEFFTYAIRHFNTMLSCPQCDAQRRIDSGSLDENNTAARGWFIACWDVLRHSHRCGKVAE